MENANVSVAVPMYTNLGFDIVETVPVRRYLQNPISKTHAVVVTYCPFMLLTKNIIEIRANIGHKS